MFISWRLFPRTAGQKLISGSRWCAIVVGCIHVVVGGGEREEMEKTGGRENRQWRRVRAGSWSRGQRAWARPQPAWNSPVVGQLLRVSGKDGHLPTEPP